METVSIETPLVSYLRRRTSLHFVLVARRVLTEVWWKDQRADNELVTLQSVMDERRTAVIDAFHIAAAARHGIQFLLTGSRKRIANARILPRIHSHLRALGCSLPVTCTPVELVEGEDARPDP